MTLVNSVASPDSTVRCHTASFETLPQTTTVTVVAYGELDAANASHFTDYAMQSATEAAQLVVDLSSIEFCGTSGFSALHDVNARCSAAGLTWSLIPSTAMRRILGICDPDLALPVDDRTDGPTAPVAGEARPLLQLVPQTG